MDVVEIPGATKGCPTPTSRPSSKRAFPALAGPFEFAFVHVKAADTFGEDGDYLGKMNFINKIDLAFQLLLAWPCTSWR